MIIYNFQINQMYKCIIRLFYKMEYPVGTKWQNSKIKNKYTFNLIIVFLLTNPIIRRNQESQKKRKQNCINFMLF